MAARSESKFRKKLSPILCVKTGYFLEEIKGQMNNMYEYTQIND